MNLKQLLEEMRKRGMSITFGVSPEGDLYVTRTCSKSRTTVLKDSDQNEQVLERLSTLIME